MSIELVENIDGSVDKKFNMLEHHLACEDGDNGGCDLLQIILYRGWYDSEIVPLLVRLQAVPIVETVIKWCDRCTSLHHKKLKDLALG